MKTQKAIKLGPLKNGFNSGTQNLIKPAGLGCFKNIFFCFFFVNAGYCTVLSGGINDGRGSAAAAGD